MNCGQLCLKKKKRNKNNKPPPTTKPKTNPEVPTSTPLHALLRRRLPLRNTEGSGSGSGGCAIASRVSGRKPPCSLRSPGRRDGVPASASHSSPQPPPTKPARHQLYRAGARNKESQTVRQSLQRQKVYLAFKKEKKEKKETGGKKKRNKCIQIQLEAFLVCQVLSKKSSASHSLH